MSTFIDLAEITYAEEIKILKQFGERGKNIKSLYSLMMEEYPDLEKFLDHVRHQSSPAVASMLWCRIWYAIEIERQRGESTTMELLSRLPDIDDRTVESPPKDCAKPLCFYLYELDRLIQSAKLLS